MKHGEIAMLHLFMAIVDIWTFLNKKTRLGLVNRIKKQITKFEQSSNYLVISLFTHSKIETGQDGRLSPTNDLNKVNGTN